MKTKLPWALSPRTLRILERLLETRFGVVCEHLSEGDDDVNPHACREEAEGLLDEIRAAGRWANVPAGIRDRLYHTACIAARMLRDRGLSYETVRRYVDLSTPDEHVALVLAEAGVEVPDGEEFAVAFVAGPACEPEALGAPGRPQSPMIRRIRTELAGADDGATGGSPVANPPRVPGHQPVA